MIMYFSGGGSPWIPEIQIPNSGVMLSYFSNCSNKTNKPDTRLLKVLKSRRSTRKSNNDDSRKQG